MTNRDYVELWREFAQTEMAFNSPQEQAKFKQTKLMFEVLLDVRELLKNQTGEK